MWGNLMKHSVFEQSKWWHLLDYSIHLFNIMTFMGSCLGTYFSHWWLMKSSHWITVGRFPNSTTTPIKWSKLGKNLTIQQLILELSMMIDEQSKSRNSTQKIIKTNWVSFTFMLKDYWESNKVIIGGLLKWHFCYRK